MGSFLPKNERKTLEPHPYLYFIAGLEGLKIGGGIVKQGTASSERVQTW
jgi:hypothetical protein